MFTRKTGPTQLKKRFINIEHALKDRTLFNNLVHSRVVLVAAYIVDHDDEMAPDVNDEVRHDLLT